MLWALGPSDELGVRTGQSVLVEFPSPVVARRLKTSELVLEMILWRKGKGGLWGRGAELSRDV